MTRIVNRTPRLRVRFSQREWDARMRELITLEQLASAVQYHYIWPSPERRDAGVDRYIAHQRRQVAQALYEKGEKFAALEEVKRALAQLAKVRQKRVEEAHAEALDIEAARTQRAADVTAARDRHDAVLAIAVQKPEQPRRRWFARR